MADNFDYAAAKESKANKFKDTFLKRLNKLKATLPLGGLFFAEFIREENKNKLPFLELFKKETHAISSWKSIKTDKLHALNRMMVVKITHLNLAKLGEYNNGSITIAPIKGKGTIPDSAQTVAIKYFKNKLNLKLIIGEETEETPETNTTPETSNTAPETSTTATEASSDTNSTLEELKKEFQAAQKIYKSLETVGVKLKAKTMLAAWQKFEPLMPKLTTFISSSDNAQEVETAKIISATIKNNQTKLKPHIDKIKVQQAIKSNAALDDLGITIKDQIAKIKSDHLSELSPELVKVFDNLDQLV